MLIIKNGTIIDGTGKPPVKSDIAVSEKKITGIGAFTPGAEDTVIDASKKIVCPGFIDTHSHSDLQILVDPQVPPKICQGITTEILGQDGIALAPLPLEYIEPWRKSLAWISGESDDIDWKFKTTRGYLALLEKGGLGPNAGYLAPHGNVRMEAMGLENKKADTGDLAKMKTILKREMDAGAMGLSTGLIYSPCSYADTNELIELCRVTAEYDGLFVIHQRSEAYGIVPSMEEVLHIGRESGVDIHFSHMKVCGKDNWDKLPIIFNMLDAAAKEGLKISFDQYPYAAGSTMLGAILPSWARAEGTERLLEHLASPEQRAAMIDQILTDKKGWDNFVSFAGLSGIFVTSTKTKKNEIFIGKNLIQIGEMTGKDPLEAALDLLLEEEDTVGMVDFYGTEEHVIEFIRRPEQNLCTDGPLGGKPHPRTYGAFPRMISEYVKKNPVLSMEAAIHKMTGKAAEVFNLKGRGILKKENYADILIFDPETICDRGTYEVPNQKPDGISMVMVNGGIVLKDGTFTENLPGKVLRKNMQV